MTARTMPAPFAAALRDHDRTGLHVEFTAGGELDTGSISLARGISLRSAQGSLRLVAPLLPETLVSALVGRHVSAVVRHRWLEDPRLVVERVDEEDDRLSIVLSTAPCEVSAEQG